MNSSNDVEKQKQNMDLLIKGFIIAATKFAKIIHEDSMNLEEKTPQFNTQLNMLKNNMLIAFKNMILHKGINNSTYNQALIAKFLQEPKALHTAHEGLDRLPNTTNDIHQFFATLAILQEEQNKFIESRGRAVSVAKNAKSGTGSDLHDLESALRDYHSEPSNKKNFAHLQQALAAVSHRENGIYTTLRDDAVERLNSLFAQEPQYRITLAKIYMESELLPAPPAFLSNKMAEPAKPISSYTSVAKALSSNPQAMMSELQERLKQKNSSTPPSRQALTSAASHTLTPGTKQAPATPEVKEVDPKHAPPRRRF